MFETAEEVLAYYKENKETIKIVLFEGKVYDVAEYMPEHPGGAEYIEEHLGEDILEPFEDAEHTKAAKKSLLKLPVVGLLKSALSEKELKAAEGAKNGGTYTDLLGQEFTSKFDNIDYDKPLLE